MANSPIRIFTKSPNEKLDFLFDATEALRAMGDTIASIAWTFPAGMTQVSAVFTAFTVLTFISGGTLGTNYTVHLKITTTGTGGGVRILEKSIQINVVDK